MTIVAFCIPLPLSRASLVLNPEYSGLFWSFIIDFRKLRSQSVAILSAAAVFARILNGCTVLMHTDTERQLLFLVPNILNSFNIR